MHTFANWILLEGATSSALTKVFARQDLETFRNHLKDTMNKNKVRHSLRVGAQVARVGGGESAVKAALFHDFLERGGDPSTMMHKLNFTNHEISLVNALSDGDKNGEDVTNGPLVHMQHILSDEEIPTDLKNALILIKLSDRIDNLTKRVRANNLSNKYVMKSKDLVTFLFGHYHGEPEATLKLRKRLKVLGVEIKKRHLNL